MKERTYRYFHGAPLYPFGYGLGYSKFAYGDMKLSSSALKAGDSLGVDVAVTNAGKSAGDDVAQVYLSFPAIQGAPIRALRAFARVHLEAGERRQVHFDLSPRDLSMVDDAGDRLVATGAYGISAGGGQPGTTATVVKSAFRIDGDLKLPE